MRLRRATHPHIDKRRNAFEHDLQAVHVDIAALVNQLGEQL